MRRKIFFIGSILLITNFVYALPVQHAPRQRSAVSKVDQALVSLITDQLVSLGLERKIAEQKVSNLFAGNINNAALNLQHFIFAFESITPEKVMHYLSKKALFDQQIDLTSYDALVGMLQRIDFSLVDAEAYAKLQNIAKINKTLL